MLGLDRQDVGKLIGAAMWRGLVTSLGSLMLAWSAAASGQVRAVPSFDCMKAASTAERQVCSSADLSQLDVRLATTFRSVLQTLGEQDRADLLANQRDWLRHRDDGCLAPNMDYESCLGGAYKLRIAGLDLVAKSPRRGLDNLLWTDGVVCEADRALVRFAYTGDGQSDDPAINAPPAIGGRLAHVSAARSQSCRLKDGRILRYKTASLDDGQAHGMCGAESDTIYSVWIGSKKVIDRGDRAGKCESDPVRAIYYDGVHLIRCQEQRGMLDEKASSTKCVDISRALSKPADADDRPQFLATWAMAKMAPFCAGLIRPLPELKDDEPGVEPYQGDTDWPQQTAAPVNTISVSDGDKLDLLNAGHPRPAYAVEATNNFFDGNFLLFPPSGMSAERIKAEIVAQRQEPDPDAARKKGFVVLAGDQTPYGEPRYVSFEPFEKDGKAWLFARWTSNRLDLPTEIVTEPTPDGGQRLVCRYQAVPDL